MTDKVEVVDIKDESEAEGAKMVTHPYCYPR